MPCDQAVRETDTCVAQSKEAYYVRSIFENFYPQQTCIETVSGGFSVACSTAKAVEVLCRGVEVEGIGAVCLCPEVPQGGDG